MNIAEEKQYLKELKQTHKSHLKNGRIYYAQTIEKLIFDCEKRIEELSKKQKSILFDGVIWKPVNGWEATHLISNTGIIKKKGYNHTNINGITRYINGGPVAQTEDKGYLKVVLTDSERTKRYVVSNLVYEHFIGEIPNMYMARPKDKDINNCNDYNLYLGKIDNTIKRHRRKVF